MAMAILGQVATVVAPEGERLVLRRDLQPVEAVLEIIPRHPLRESELVEALENNWPNRVGRILAILAGHPHARRCVYRGEPFWTYARRV
ncbi:MAG: hypothetical protein M8861_04410 [marine benthic group bacterium]|nr:hypothetical protein [Gemmatimonadota bacterium]